jgi:hypothetical protein
LLGSPLFHSTDERSVDEPRPAAVHPAADHLGRALIAATPDFRSCEGHLLYARAVEAEGDLEAALHEYEALAQGYPGEEGRVRYGLLLKRHGGAAKANEVFREVLTRADVSPKYYRREQREWIEIAKRELG